MCLITARLFGKFSVQINGQTLSKLTAKRARELLAYLLLHRDCVHYRQPLAYTLWDTQVEHSAMKYLRHALWQLQSALNALDEGEALLHVDVETIGLNPQIDLWLDVAEFEKAFIQIQNIPGKEFNVHHINLVQEAIELYQSGLLESWYCNWCCDRREHLRDVQISMLSKLMDSAEMSRDYQAALTYGARILRYDAAHEDTHCRLMRIHYLAGNRVSALRQYEHCVEALRVELDVMPSEPVQLLFSQIRADQIINSNQLIHKTSQGLEHGSQTLPVVLLQLKQFDAILTQIQSQIRDLIDDVETTLRV